MLGAWLSTPGTCHRTPDTWHLIASKASESLRSLEQRELELGERRVQVDMEEQRLRGWEARLQARQRQRRHERQCADRQCRLEHEDDYFNGFRDHTDYVAQKMKWEAEQKERKERHRKRADRNIRKYRLEDESADYFDGFRDVTDYVAQRLKRRHN